MENLGLFAETGVPSAMKAQGRPRKPPVNDDRSGGLDLFFKFLIFHQRQCILCDGFSPNLAIFLPFILAMFKCSTMITFSSIAQKTLIIRFKS